MSTNKNFISSKNKRRAAGKNLNYSEESRGHSRERHNSPTLEDGPSIDAYLKARFNPRDPDGRTMSAFLKTEDQDRAVAYAFDQTDDHTINGTRTTMRVRTAGTLNNINVRVVEKSGGVLQGYNAKLREVLVVVDNLGKNNQTIITAYPSDFYR